MCHVGWFSCLGTGLLETPVFLRVMLFVHRLEKPQSLLWNPIISKTGTTGMWIRNKIDRIDLMHLFIEILYKIAAHRIHVVGTD